MIEVVLTYSTGEGSEEIFIEDEKTSFGRGGDAKYRFEDDGLSRLHATIYREDDRIWIVDENSSNGTFVNEEKVTATGTPIRDGDTIKIGNYTNLFVSIGENYGHDKSAETPSQSHISESAAVQSMDAEKPSALIPLLVTGFALFVIFGAAIFIGVIAFGNNRPQVVQNRDDFEDETTEDPIDENSPNPTTTSSTPTTSPSTDITEQSPTPGDSTPPESAETPPEDNRVNIPSGKKYQAMSDSEKNQYIKVKSEKVARIIGNRSGQSIPPDAIAKIRRFLSGYVSRIRRTKRDDCGMGSWVNSDMVSVLERAQKNAPFVIRAFNEKRIDPQVGLYLAMIESEHCPCLQSSTGPLGMFQFTRATGKRHGLDTRAGATPANPDERCQPKAAARAAASYMKSLTARIGTGPLSVPLAIASYNSGEGGLGKNLRIALQANESQDRSFWTLVANAEKLAKQFQSENIKYVPKFFAAAIVGENPRDFGISMQPLSTYTK